MMFAKHHFFALGTTISIQLQAPRAQELVAEAEEWIKQQELVFSLYKPSSELSRLNASAGIQPHQCSDDLYDLIKLGKAASLRNDTFLNIAIAPLVQAWQISFADARRPSQTEINNLLKLCRAQDIQLMDHDKTVYLNKVGMAIDLGALAKGYLADKLLQSLIKKQASSILLNFGGNVICYGKSNTEEDRWRIGLRHPATKEPKKIGILQLTPCAITTSGTYERFSVIQGETYHHLINPQTGHPFETDITSLTIISPTAFQGEILTSQLYGLPIKEILKLIEATQDCEAIITTRNNQIFMTKGAKINYRSSFH